MCPANSKNCLPTELPSVCLTIPVLWISNSILFQKKHIPLWKTDSLLYFWFMFRNLITYMSHAAIYSIEAHAIASKSRASTFNRTDAHIIMKWKRIYFPTAKLNEMNWKYIIQDIANVLWILLVRALYGTFQFELWGMKPDTFLFEFMKKIWKRYSYICI